MDTAKVAIIGAGVAGLACARALRAAGIEVCIYDKGRGPGGRCSSRRSPFGRFDHGAQFFTVRDDGFRAQVDEWLAAGVAAQWGGHHVGIEGGDIRPYDGDARYVGTPAMNAFIRHEADASGAQFGFKMARPTRQASGAKWLLHGAGGRSAWQADWVVFAIPAEQSAVLVPPGANGGSDALIEQAKAANADPTWTLMASFEDGTANPFDAASITGDDLSWVSREAAKPGREAGSRWVAHASADWTTAHLEDQPDAVLRALVDALRRVIGEEADLTHADVHRWRYAQVAHAAPGQAFGLDADAQLATCGDWHVAPRVESAWVSGDALGRALAAAV